VMAYEIIYDIVDYQNVRFNIGRPGALRSGVIISGLVAELPGRAGSLLRLVFWKLAVPWRTSKHCSMSFKRSLVALALLDYCVHAAIQA